MSASSAHPNFYRVTRRRPCPICGGADQWCRVFDDGGVECMHSEEDGTPCRSGGRMHWPNGRERQGPIAVIPSPPKPMRPAIDADFVNQVYRALLELCPLSPEDRAYLREKRHFTDEQIDRHGYGTMPELNQSGRRRLAAAVATKVGRDPGGLVPGFLRTPAGTELIDLTGIFVPFLDNQGRIVGLQVRAKDPAAKPRYKWLSFGDREGSVGQNGNAVHVARPARPHTTRHVAITEGPFKGNTVADRFNVVTLAVGGVTNTAEILSTIQELGDVDAVTLAFDADIATNELVATSETKLAAQLAEAGLTVEQWHWSAENGKGIDDLVNAGLLPRPRVHPAASARRTAADQNPEVGERVTRLQTERDAAMATTRARARIQRNKRLPARDMAIVLTGVFSHAATSSAAAGAYTGKIPDGYVSASVRELAIDAGCGENNAGKQLKDLEQAGIIKRHTLKEMLLAGQIDPDSGEMLTTPRVYSRHFVAMAGQEEERPTVEAVHELIERMATYTSEIPERRGGKRIPRCELHPHAQVIKRWEARCSECDAILETGEDLVPAMHLEPLSPRDQSLGVRDESDLEDELGASPTRDQTLVTREHPSHSQEIGRPAHTTVCAPSNKDSLGNRIYVPKKCERGELSPHDQTLVDRRRRAAEDLAARAERANTASPPPESEPGPRTLSLFVIETAECRGCGAVIPEGATYCASCDDFDQFTA